MAYYTIDQYAERLGVHRQKVSEWIANGSLSATDVSGRPGIGRPRWRISVEAAERFEQSRTTNTTKTTAPRKKKRQYRFTRRSK